MALTDKELISIVDGEMESAMGSEGGEISQERAKAYKYYLSKKFGDEISGQSQLVTSDVAEVVDGIMPSLLKMFTTADNLVSFDAIGPEDEDMAAQCSDYVNYTFFKQNPAFEIMYSWFFDALVQKNGIVKAWWDDSEIVTTENYTSLTRTELLQLLEDEELEPVERLERTESIKNPETGEIIDYQVHDIEFKRISNKGQVRIENVPPEEYRISNDSRSIDPSKARMVGHERLATRSDLLSMGFDKKIVNSLPSHAENNLDSDEKIARYDKTDDDQYSSNRDRSQDEILLREAYIKIDYEQNGRAELRQVITAGHQILYNESADSQPFHVVCPQPLPHKHFGRATAEKVMDIQEVRSNLLRQIHDNLYHTNNPGKNVYEQAIGENTIDDLMTTRVGRIARFSRPVNEAYSVDAVPFTAAASFPMLEYWDKTKRDRTGVSSDSEGLSPESLKNIQTSVLSQAVDLSKMKIEAIARIFAETGIKSLLLHIHELLLKHQNRSQVVKLRNRWVEINPSSWRTRYDMTVNIGLGIGTRQQNMLTLNDIWEKQKDVISGGGGGTLVTAGNVYNTASEIVKNANYKNADMFFTQADSIEPPQDPMAEQQMALAQRQQELDAANLELKQQKLQVENEQKANDRSLRAEKQADDLFVAMEKIANQLTEMELVSGREASKAQSENKQNVEAQYRNDPATEK